MARAAPKIRLYVEATLTAGASIGLSPERAHYLGRVMRLARGDEVAVFNGEDGEWRAVVEGIGKGWCSLAIAELVREQAPEPDLWFVFAPIKRARIDYMAEKATELGAAALCPAITDYTAVARVNVSRLRANAVEAAEQCGRLSVPAVHEPEPLARLLARWPSERRLMVCDESGGGQPAGEVLTPGARGPWAVLVGPEGGFSPAERGALSRLPGARAVSLGPRALRAETAGIVALALWQYYLGDWSETALA